MEKRGKIYNLANGKTVLSMGFKSIENLIFNIDIKTVVPSQGKLLVAEPFLREDYFLHAVICLIEYEDQGTAMGVVMNHRIRLPLQKLMDGVNRKEKVPVYCGGPMSRDRLYFLHTLGDIIPESREISKGVYVGGDFRVMKDYVNDGYPLDGKIRFFVGYSGWSRMQLKEEIKDNVWAVTKSPSPSMLLTGEGDSYWHRTVRSMGPEYRGWLYHPRNVHDN